MGYKVSILPVDEVVIDLIDKISAVPVGKASDIILLNFNTPNVKYSQTVLNELIDVFNMDGVMDRQLIHKRTIDFVNDRYYNLSLDLDSIESDKLLYKTKNKLVDLEINTSLSLQKSSNFEEKIFSNESQIYIVKSLLQELSIVDLELLPTNIGIQSIEINDLINSYNEKILEKNKLKSSAGPNNPSVIQMTKILEESRKNIFFSLDNYLVQLNSINNQLREQFNDFDNQITSLPQKEKSLDLLKEIKLFKNHYIYFYCKKGRSRSRLCCY